ncbi:monovalent cation/H(+) antiporter subunit G [Shinella daejeonensis]|uniref:monovalent cation/H(+) antiporter subunit G n=1 Tax=Shinella daejeonensis TaxID=659017 RepID=UPI0020C80A28|nr:monovalent cation/H(+) antiporter subunit G [Shinella daejeonensis]MCP8897052.1 monovalent cation/H(+) antiporter subunit G [Shinella daejeonensis]
MTGMLLALLVAAMLVAGGIFTFLAALGLLRLPDVYTRMHAASKAGTVGSGLMLLAAGIHSLDIVVFARAIAGFVFFILTAPIAAHLVAKAAHEAGYRLTRFTVLDEMRDARAERSKRRG